MRINEAFEKAAKEGRRINKNEIAALIWPGTKESSRRVNMSNLCNGKTTRVEERALRIICEQTGVDMNFLLSK